VPLNLPNPHKPTNINNHVVNITPTKANPDLPSTSTKPNHNQNGVPTVSKVITMPSSVPNPPQNSGLSKAKQNQLNNVSEPVVINPKVTLISSESNENKKK